MSAPDHIAISLTSPPARDTMFTLTTRSITFLSINNPQVRLKAIETIFAPDAVWFDSDGSAHHGHDGVLAHSTIVMNQQDGTVHSPAEDIKVCQNMATSRWKVVPEGTEGNPGQAPSQLGGNVIVVEGAKIKVLWSYLDNFQPPLRPSPEG
ncbi:hypothetical protein HYQ44_001864 [Verticillium longisporum]|nr:hypothetical protein HYQ44_001864 [Verticillium longisporum]